MREAYVTLGKYVAALFGAELDIADSDMREILALEIELANVSLPSDPWSFLFNPFPNKPCILHVCSTCLLKTL